MEMCQKRDPVSALVMRYIVRTAFLLLLEKKRNFWTHVHEKLGNIHYLELFSFQHR